MEFSMEDAAPFEELRPIGTPQKQGQAMSREIADSDAEDDAMDIDDERPRKQSTVDPKVQDPTEQPDEVVQITALYQVEEDGPSSVVEPAAVLSVAREASPELGMEIDDKIDDKSSEKHLHGVADNEASNIQVETTESLSMADNDHKTNTAENTESFGQMNDTEPNSSPSNHLNDHTEEESRPDARLDPQAVEVESFQNATTPESCETPVNSEDIGAKVPEDSIVLKDVSSDLTTSQSEETMLAGDATILDVAGDNATRSKSPDLESAEDLTADLLASAATTVPEALTEDRSRVHKASQDQNEDEAISPSSFLDKSLEAPSSDAAEQLLQQASNLEPSQAKPTPDQKRMANLQARNTSLTQSLTSLSQQRTALLHSLSTHLSIYTLADIPSVLKPYRGKAIYTPSTAAHTIPLPAPITPEDDTKLMAEARQAIKDHIGRLHRYNEIRDVGQGLIGMIADQRGKRIVDCMDEFGVEVGD